MRTLIFISLLAIVFIPDLASADWLIYHKPAFEGQILDGETKEPIEGAVVVALYSKRTLGLGAGTLSSVIEIREALTDREGRFRIPSYATVIQPFSWSSSVFFTIYKPGYASLDEMNLEDLFAGRASEFPLDELPWVYNQKRIFRFRAPNIVELPKPTTRDEQIKSLPVIPGPDLPARKMRNLIDLSNMERARFGFNPEKFK